MHLLILTQNYFPEPDAKMHVLAKCLVAREHSVTVLTGFPNYPTGKIYSGYRQKMWQKENIDGVKVIRLPIYPDKSRSILKRSLNYLSFPLSATLLGPILCGKIDLIFVYSPPITIGIPAFIISKLRRVPFIFEIQDLWPETLPATGMVNNHVILNLLGKIANFTYLKASAITVISPGFKRNLISKKVPSGKIHVFYNWAYEGDFIPPKPNKNLANYLGMSGYFNILYAGNLGPAQGLHNVLETAVMLKDLEKIQFVLIGDGGDKDRLNAIIKKEELTNVKLLPRQEMKTMPEIYSLSDAVLVHLTNDPLFSITIPGKTQSYLLSGRPIIVSVDGDAADLVVRAGAGISAEAMNPKDLNRAIKQLYYMDRKSRECMGKKGRAFYYKKLAPDVQATNYEQLFRNVIYG